MTSEAIDHLRKVVGPDSVITDPREMEPYVTSWRDNWRGRVAMVLRPATVDELVSTVRYCAEWRIPMVPQGGRTGVTGAAQPRMNGNEVVISMERMNRIIGLDPENETITVEAGCILADVRAAADEAGLLFPLSFGAVGSCLIGGVVSTNAGGINVLRYGNTRNLVLGLEVVLPDGQVWDGLRSLRKDNAGYDLKQLFIGSEGTLGFVTKAVLRLVPKPRSSVSALVAVDNPATAVRLLRRARSDFSETLTAFELIEARCVDITLEHLGESDSIRPGKAPWYCLIEVSGPASQETCLEAVTAFLEAAYPDEVSDARVAMSQKQSDALWRMRESIPDAHNRAGNSIKHDISVPVSHIVRFLDESETELRARYPSYRSFTFGHLGDGNLHFNPLIEPESGDPSELRRDVNRIVHDVVSRHGGSVSAEHGVGQVRLSEIERYRSDVELMLMRRVKDALDPDNLMNPGKVLRERSKP